MICLFDEEFAGEVEKRNSVRIRENIFGSEFFIVVEVV